MERAAIPITVIGGYLGAGKTTLLNRLLADPHGRRLGVIVNDFGSIGIDAELLADAAPDGVVNLPNGCVCCTLGEDLYESLRTLRDADVPPDHIVIEASGVADPAVAAAWGTSSGFAPGGVIVLAAANTIRQQVRDKYVGGEVRRQLAGADLVVVTKHDLCSSDEATSADALIADMAPRTMRTFDAVAVDASLVFGLRPDDVPEVLHEAVQHSYQRWSWVGGTVSAALLDQIVHDLPDAVIRLKGTVALDDGHRAIVQTVGQQVGIEASPADDADGTSRLVAILQSAGDLGELTAQFDWAAGHITDEQLRTLRHR